MKKATKKKKKNSQEMQHAENLDETSISILSLDENVVRSRFPSAHKDEEVISPKDADDSMGDLSDMVDHHLDDFIQVGKRRWDVSASFFIEISFTTLRVVLVQKGLSCHL